MQLLLPPSEAKAPGGRGRPLNQREPHPELDTQRSRMLDALADLVAGPAATAAEKLLLPDSVAAAALAANRTARTSRTMPALHRYQGVVYDGLGFASLSPAAQRLAARRCFVFSGLFGVVRGDEPIPDYRVPAKSVLPGIGIAGTAWRPVLDGVLPELFDRGPIVDLRSSDYAAMWRPDKALAGRTFSVRVLSPLPNGGLGVVSYPSKYAKGQLAAALVEAYAAGQRPKRAGDFVDIWIAATGLPAKDVGNNQIELYTAG